ncbi:hypothetical protein BT63DRAFT_440477 [Microthyrium microscopicum]|uniref:Zn(2)-C6 fungal-type domain-containing protein n=1 Tax=Microthyrium microscopicum TaxID=703497 RepID=A0A6A6UAY5_9PEZI|nr:hypothetical protein BT63DRAFT_440477 [Microthyrium microscopicum]
MSTKILQPICPAPKVLTACDNCRSRKLRCLASTTPGICERCAITRSKCKRDTVRRLGGRKKSDKDSGQVAQSLRKVPDEDQNHTDVVSGFFNSILELKKGQKQILLSLAQNHDSMLMRHFPESWMQCSENGSIAAPSRESKHGKEDASQSLPRLNRNEATAYLAIFKEREDHFPFVPLSGDLDLTAMLRSRPFLTLAILCAMSANKSDVQKRLDIEFRRAVNEKVLVSSEGSLDVLQGLLIYLAWFPLHLSPRKGRLFNMLAIAANMVKDLGYDSPPDSFDSRSEAESLAIKLAYLGCFCLCSTYSLPPVRPAALCWTPYLESCLIEISQTQTSASVLATLRLIDFETTGCTQTFSSAPDLQTRLSELTQSLKPELQRMAHIRLLKQFVSTRISIMSTLDSQEPQDDLARSCRALKSLFSAFMEINDEVYHEFSAIDWNLLIRGIISVFQLLTWALENPNPNPLSVTDLASFGPYLESIQAHLSKLSSTTADANSAPDIYYLFDSVLDVVRNKYERMSKQLQSHNLETTEHWNQYRYVASLCPVMDGSLRKNDHWSNQRSDQWSNQWSNQTLDSAVFESLLLQDLDMNVTDSPTIHCPFSG